MNHLQVFLNTKIQNLGLLSFVGNFFLAPARFFFSGKSILINENENIDKVSSFHAYRGGEDLPGWLVKDERGPKKSKQTAKLESTGWGFLTGAFVTPLIMAILFVPFTLLGVVVKTLSLFNPTVRKAHNFVKQRLTPIDKCLGSEEFPIENNRILEEQLQEYLKTGQKTNFLIIHAKEALSPNCLKLIGKVNPLKLVLVDKWTKDELASTFLFLQQFRTKNKWENKKIPLSGAALRQAWSGFIPKSYHVNSVAEALNYVHAAFFKHRIYVVKNDLGQQNASDTEQVRVAP